MFKNHYQGGPTVDIFSAHGNNPVANWKLHGKNPSITKVFDKDLKGFVYSLEGSSQAHRMQLPKDGKMPLGLIQKFLILQVNVPLGKAFSVEILVTDEEHLKKRLYLSTIHKELSSTPLHARIPLTCLQRSTWCYLCIDLDSITAEIFRGARFLSLEGVIVSACCKLRRIFTMKNQPADNLEEEIPRTFVFPFEVQHVVQLVDFQTLGLTDPKSGQASSNPEETGGIKAAITKRPTPQDSSHIAFGSKVIGPPPLTARKNISSLSRKEERSKSELSLNMSSGQTENAQPLSPLERPSTDRTGSSRPPRAHSERGRKSSADKKGGKVSLNQEGSELQGEAALSSLQTRRSDLTAEDKLIDPTLQDCGACADTSGSALEPPCASSPSERVLTTDDADLCDTEAELSLCEQEYEEEVFTFSSCPHSARRNQASSNPVEDLTFGLKGHKPVTEGERKDARLEDDFIGSESEEDEMPTDLLNRYSAHSLTAPSPAPKCPQKFPSEPIKSPASTAHVSEGPKRHEPLPIAPTRCLSPSPSRQGSRLHRSEARRLMLDGESRVSISRASVRELSPNDAVLHKVSLDGGVRPLGSSRCAATEEEDELRMLASLKREHDEEQDGSFGLSASQVHHCNAGLSESSDDTSTWTQCVSLPVEQGHHYQKEMNPLLLSNPREWMHVLSPPIIHPDQQHTDGGDGDDKFRAPGLDRTTTMEMKSFSI